MALTVQLLVWLGVAIELACCVGLVTVRSAIDRLHFAGAATVVGPTLVAVAVPAARPVGVVGAWVSPEESVVPKTCISQKE